MLFIYWFQVNIILLYVVKATSVIFLIQLKK